MNTREIARCARISHSRVSRIINEVLIGFADTETHPDMKEQLAKFPIDGAMDFRY